MQQQPPHRSTHHPHRRTAMKPTMAAALALSALATGPAGAQDPHPATAVPDPARHHASILAIQGGHLVDFAFDETVLLQPRSARSPALPSRGPVVLILAAAPPTRAPLPPILMAPQSGPVPTISPPS